MAGDGASKAVGRACIFRGQAQREARVVASDGFDVGSNLLNISSELPRRAVKKTSGHSRGPGSYSRINSIQRGETFSNKLLSVVNTRVNSTLPERGVLGNGILLVYKSTTLCILLAALDELNPAHRVQDIQVQVTVSGQQLLLSDFNKGVNKLSKPLLSQATLNNIRDVPSSRDIGRIPGLSHLVKRLLHDISIQTLGIRKLSDNCVHVSAKDLEEISTNIFRVDITLELTHLPHQEELGIKFTIILLTTNTSSESGRVVSIRKGFSGRSFDYRLDRHKVGRVGVDSVVNVLSRDPVGNTSNNSITATEELGLLDRPQRNSGNSSFYLSSNTRVLKDITKVPLIRSSLAYLQCIRGLSNDEAINSLGQGRGLHNRTHTTHRDVSSGLGNESIKGFVYIQIDTKLLGQLTIASSPTDKSLAELLIERSLVEFHTADAVHLTPKL